MAAIAAGCGGSDGDSATRRRRPPTPTAPVSGTLRTFTYSDTASDVILDPFRKQNPDLELKTATFDSVQEGAAKLAGGFEADVVNVCSDEYQPLVTRGLLRPIDPAAIEGWDELAFRDNEGVRAPRRHGQLRPGRRRPPGPALQHRGGRARPRLLGRPLRPAVRRAGLDGRRHLADPDRRDGGGARHREPDGAHRRAGRAGQAEADRHEVAVPQPSPARTPRSSTCSRAARSCSPTAGASTRCCCRPRASRSSGWRRRRERSRGSAGSGSPRRPRTSPPPTS